MMHRFLYLKRASHIALLVLLLSLVGMTKTHAQDFTLCELNNSLIEKGIVSNGGNGIVVLNVKALQSYEERVATLFGIWSDERIWIEADESDGSFLVGRTELLRQDEFELALASIITRSCQEMLSLSKEDRSDAMEEMKRQLPDDFMTSLMMDYYERSMTSGNNVCIAAERICFQDGLYTFPAGVNAGSGESGPNYDCLRTQPNPAWFFVEMQEPGNIDIYMYTSPSHDIDFCCWGPFENLNVCPTGLTLNKVVSCSYSAQPTEHCMIPSTAQTGEYYILVITNYSNQSCNINFSKVSGTGNSDCIGQDYYVGSNSPVCYGNELHLYSRSIQGASYSWIGPDGWTSTQRNPIRTIFTMEQAGTYYCSITTSEGTVTMFCEVECTPAVVADFIYTSVCLGDTTEFVCTGSTNPPGYSITSIEWNLGDGTTATGYSVKHKYETAGNKSVTVNVHSEEACSGSKTYSVPVYYLPNANAGNDQYTRVGGIVTLTGSSGTGDFAFHWSPEDLVINPNMASTQTVPLYETQDFVLTVSSNAGNCTISTDTVRIIVDPNAMVGSVYADDDEVCHGVSTQLHAVATGGTGNYYYSWTPTTGLSAPNIANPIVNTLETRTYTCHFSDGQTTMDVPITITVHPTYFNLSTESICEGDAFTWHGQTYTQQGVYTQNYYTIHGCDSIIGLNLVVNPVYNVSVEAEACEYYVWDGSYYYESGIYQQLYETVNGCDSVVNLNLVINYGCHHWSSIEGYEDSMDVYAVAAIDEMEQRTEQLEIGAFCVNSVTNEIECRGTAMFAYQPAIDKYVAHLTISGNDGEQIFYRLYDHEQFEELPLVSDNTTFVNGTILGGNMNPYTIGFFHSYSITVESNNLQYGTVSGGGTYLYGSMVTLSAVPNWENFVFESWTENGVIVSTESNYTFMAETDRNLMANFVYPIYTINTSINPGNSGTVHYNLEIGFEDGYEGWTVIDTNHDGFTWTLANDIPSTWTYYSNLIIDWHHTGSNSICSGSYINGIGALHPDEYLVSPQVNITNGTHISFYAAAADVAYAADHFGVFVSNGSPTDPNDFYEVQSWTMTAKEGGTVDGDNRTLRNGVGQRIGNWYYYDVDLSAYAGAGYIAFRHFNCYDQYIICIDDVTITKLDNTEEGIYHQGQTCMLTAAPNSGFDFVNWTEDGEIVSTESTYSFTVTGDRNLVANFIPYSHHWTTESYPYSMFMLGVVQIDGIEQASPTIELGAFCNGECRGTVFPFEEDGRWLYFMNIVGNSGDEITFRLYDHALQQELDLYCYIIIPFEESSFIGVDNPYEVQFASTFTIAADVNPVEGGTVLGTGDYGPGTSATLVATPNEGYAFNCWTLDGEVVSTEPSYTFTVTESMNFTANFDVLQLQQLTSGWNWFSTYLEITLDDLKAALLAAFPNVGANALVIKSNSNGNTAWNPIAHRWIGGLTTMDLSQMYMVKVPANAVITLQGVPINPADHPVTIVNGNNWIAFPFRENMSVNNAFAGFPVNGDIIKSNGDGAAAFYGVMWIGGLNTLNPGKGYIYKSNAQESRTFVFGTNAAK